MDAFSARSPPAPAAIQPRRVYDLPKLIDLAQQTNPETRATWQEARAAAARLGIAEGAYLPTLSAIGMASYAHLPDYDKMGPFLVGTGVLEPLVRLDWLLLDSVDAAPISPARPRCGPPLPISSRLCHSISSPLPSSPRRSPDTTSRSSAMAAARRQSGDEPP